VQHLRAAEPGRGREARAPTQIPRPGWKDIVLRTYQEVQDDRLLALAAGVAFYSPVALFPALAAGVSVYALFADAATIAGHLSAASNIVPAAGLDILSQEISRLAAKSDGTCWRKCRRRCIFLTPTRLMVSNTQSRGAFRRSRTCIGCSWKRAGQGQTFTVWSRRNLQVMSKRGERRVQLDGPDILLEPNAAQAIAVSLHELATNAAKYGALSRPNGHVEVAWSRTPDGIVLRWTPAKRRRIRVSVRA
jgi:hypothetical protein